MWQSLADVPESIIKAYQSNRWSCAVPSGPTARWDTLAWINHIGEPELRRVANTLGY